MNNHNQAAVTAAPRHDQGPVVLENDHLRIVFDRRGRVTDMLNRRTGIAYLRAGSTPVTSFAVDVYHADGSNLIHDAEEQEDGGFAMADPHLSLTERHGDLMRLTAESAAPVISSTRRGKTQTLKFAYALSPAIAFEFTVSLAESATVAVWRCKVANRKTAKVAERRRVYRVRFPILPNLCLGGTPTHNYLARTLAQGELLRNPARETYQAEENWVNKSHPPLRTHLLTYPGWASMPWTDLYLDDPAHPEQRCGLYLASYDPSFRQTDFVTIPNPAAETIELRIQTFAFLEPGHKWTSQDFITGMHAGDWHWAGDRYRTDSRTWLKPYHPPQWIREADGWFGTGAANYRYADLPKMLDDARWLGLDYLQCWSEMIETFGPDAPQKHYYCFFLPSPDRGGEAELRKACRVVRERGGHIGFYSNIWTFDAELPRPLDYWKAAIPPDVKVPDWQKEFRAYGSVFPDGHREEGDYINGYAGMCLSAKGYRDYLKFWIVDKYVHDYGVDAWYLDSCPVTMFNAARVCFNGDHASAPHGVGQGTVALVRELREASHKDVDLAISSETISDALMQYNSHALGIEMVAGFHHPKPEIYAYTFPEQIIFSGTCNGAGRGLKYYYPEMTNPTREDTMNQVFLQGFRFDILGYPVYKTDPYHQYLRKLIALRQQIKGELYTAAFKDTVGLGARPAQVEARVFRGQDGKGLIVTLFDRRADTAAFTLTIDPSALEVTRPRTATLYTLDGKAQQLDCRDEGAKQFAIAVPARTGAVAVVVVH